MMKYLKIKICVPIHMIYLEIPKSLSFLFGNTILGLKQDNSKHNFVIMYKMLWRASTNLTARSWWLWKLSHATFALWILCLNLIPDLLISHSCVFFVSLSSVFPKNHSEVCSFTLRISIAYSFWQNLY